MKLPTPCREYRASELHFHLGYLDEARSLVVRYHYSHLVPSNIQLVATFHADGGLFGDNGPAVAAAIFTFPPARWSERLIELARLVREDEIRVPLTRLISLSCKELKKRGHDLIVSYADASEGHEGYVYRASSWNYHGMRPPKMDGVIVNGQYIACRTANHVYGTHSLTKLADLFPDHEITGSWDEGKHLYWKPLTRNGKAKAARLGLETNPYTKGGDA